MFGINTTHKIPCVLTTNYSCLWQTSTHSLKLNESQCFLNSGKHMVCHEQKLTVSLCHTSLTGQSSSCLPPLPIKGCFDQAAKNEIPSEHPPPGKKPSLQWVICYSLGEKDKVSTELFTMAYDRSLSASPLCNVASLWSFFLKLLRAHSSCTWPFADYTKKIR